ncbi:cytochrome C biogenesis protein, partial [Candidatus Woesearchaeota archaeon]|nr:cytochrome C biogenesis protein [Candidatus Woesearchaeota archaeon]
MKQKKDAEKNNLNDQNKPVKEKRDWRIFLASVFFVLGFAVVFSLVGVLLQSVLSEAAPSIQVWLGRVGGVIIIAFGLYLLGLLKIKFLEK